MIDCKTLFGAAAASAVLLIAGVASPAAAQATNYTLSGVPPYSSLNNGAATPCEFAPCPVFATGEKISGSFRLSAPLAANLSSVEIAAADVTSYSFSNGGTTFASTDPNVRLNQINITTDADGNVTDFGIWLNRWNILPHSSGDVANGRLGYMYVTSDSQYSQHNMTCSEVGTAPSGTTDTCVSNGAGSDRTFANGDGPNTLAATPAVAAPTPVPTLSEWAMILFGLMLAGGAALYIQRRQMSA